LPLISAHYPGIDSLGQSRAILGVDSLRVQRAPTRKGGVSNKKGQIMLCQVVRAIDKK
jgi:hypothetical protein